MQDYIDNIVAVFDECWRVLKDDGTAWLNLGNSYASSWASGRRNLIGNGSRDNRVDRISNETIPFKEKDLMMVPHRVAIALQERGWYVRSDIIWHKPNPMPESVRDRPTQSHEHIFLLSKNKKYYYDADAIRTKQKPSSVNRAKYSQVGFEKGQMVERNAVNYVNNPNTNEETQRKAREGYGANRKSVWTISTRAYSGAHFATFPPEIPELCIKAGTSERGNCPECGNPWVRVVEKTGRVVMEHGSKKMDVAVDREEKRNSLKVMERLTLDWKPTCDHDLEPVPAIVLDPFGGSGTTARKADDLGRTGISLDLSWDYLQLAKDRTGMTALDQWQNGIQAGANLDGLPMFGELS